jgi:hypothetical protein
MAMGVSFKVYKDLWRLTVYQHHNYHPHRSNTHTTLLSKPNTQPSITINMKPTTIIFAVLVAFTAGTPTMSALEAREAEAEAAGLLPRVTISVLTTLRERELNDWHFLGLPWSPLRLQGGLGEEVRVVVPEQRRVSYHGVLLPWF